MTAELEGLPNTIGRYQVKRLLGRGGMGRVVAGHDPVLRRDVAIKLVEPAAVALEDLAELRFLFHREARATAALHHPNIVEVFDYSGPDTDLMFIAVELIDGPTLAEILAQRGALPSRVTAAIGYELAEALDMAHQESIVHRDLKPENIYWTPAGRVVLSDFGIAKAFAGSDRLGGTIQFGGTSLYGSPSFMAPEQLTGGEITPRTDLYALGAVLYECLTGQEAFGGKEIQTILDAVVAGDHQPVGELVAAPAPLVDLVECLLATDPQKRPADARQVAEELRRVLDELGVTDPRLCLREDVEPPGAADAVGAEAKERRMYEGRPVERIRIPDPKGGWAKLATRGPALLGMIAVAVALAIGVHLFRQMLRDVEPPTAEASDNSADEPTVTTDTATPPTAADASDVFVLLKLEGDTTLYVDGVEIGRWNDFVRLALPPGRHTLEARSARGVIKREVLLLKGTQPTFELFDDP